MKHFVFEENFYPHKAGKLCYPESFRELKENGFFIKFEPV